MSVSTIILLVMGVLLLVAALLETVVASVMEERARTEQQRANRAAPERVSTIEVSPEALQLPAPHGAAADHDYGAGDSGSYK